jgi:hypothetical protein
MPLVRAAKDLSPKVRLLSSSRDCGSVDLRFFPDARSLKFEHSVDTLLSNPGLSSSMTLDRRLFCKVCLNGVYRVISAAGG